MNIRHTFVLAVVLALTAGYLLLAPPGTRGTPQEGPTWFYITDEGDIVALEVEHRGQRETFLRQGEDWFFQSPPNLPVNLDRWGGILLLASGPRSRRLLLEAVEDPAHYGLDPPQGRITLRLRDDRSLTVLMGDLTPDGSGQYVMLEGSPRLFVVDAGWGQVLGRLATEPPYPYWYPHWSADQVTELLVEGEGRVSAFTYDEDQGWRRDDASQAPVEPERWKREVEPLLAGPPRLEVIRPRLEDPTPYGLDRPRLTVRLLYRLPQPVADRTFGEAVYRIGQRDGGAYYATPKATPGLPQPLLRLDAEWVEGMARLLAES